MNASTLFEALKHILYNSGRDSLLLFAPLFGFGLLLYLFSKWTRNCFKNSGLERLDIYGTGIIGVPIHEIGHLIFCIIFGHTLTQIHLFKPSEKELGSIEHRYNSRNIYHLVGNFFIGIGPILFGSLVLWLLAYLLLDQSWQSLDFSVHSQTLNWQNLALSTPTNSLNMAKHLLNTIDWNTPSQWLFIYLSMSIASHMELSPPDISGMLSGLFTLVVILIFANAILYFGSFTQHYSLAIYKSTIGPLYGFFMYALVISSMSFCIVFILTTLYSLFRKGALVNPLR